MKKIITSRLSQENAALIEQQKAFQLVLYVVVAYCATVLFFNVIVLYMFHLEATNEWLNWIYLIVIAGVLTFLLPILNDPLHDIGLKLHHWRNFLEPLGIILIFFGVLKIAENHNLPYVQNFSFNEYFHELFKAKSLLYLLHAAIQDALGFGIFLVSLLKVLPSRPAISHVLLTSLLFGILHIDFGLGVMFGSFLLAFLLGLLFLHQRTLWGIVCIHYVVGIFYIHFWQM